jgi:CPA1 family monovalent cation:H+ antiporter
MRQQGVATGLRTLIEGESIFNDAVGIVLFGIAFSNAFPSEGEVVGFARAIEEFFLEVVIGVAVGVVFGYTAHTVMRLVDDHLVEITLSVALAFGSFLVSDRFGGSGVIAVVAGGLLIGNYRGYRAMSPSSQALMREFWEILAFLLNSALFLLIGLAFDLDTLLGGETALAAIVAAVALLLGRCVATYGLLWPARYRRSGPPIPKEWQHAIVWGGLRGSIPVALVLGLSASERDLGGVNAVAVVFFCVLVSLVGQGLTFAPLLRRLRLSSSRASA